MQSLSKENRKLLENTVAAARAIAVKGATTVLRDQYAVGESASWPHMTDVESKLRVKLRAHGRQLGDRRDPHRDTQELDRLAQACAYEHWHRMLFARFLAENDLLLDPDHGVAMTLEEIRELAQEQHRDWQELAAELAQRMLLAVFRPEDPVLAITLPPETRLQLEEKLALLPAEVFLADDSLGWVYQFWQRDEKERVNKSEVKIGADELSAVTQLFTEDYMVLFLLENTLGAWWTAKRHAEGKNLALPDYTWTYLRLNEDGSPVAGGFNGWPRAAKELRILDPCMGSGHFLAFALPILARMRMEEEGLGLADALVAVIKDNLFGLELDARCAQIAAFNLALTAWRMVGEHFALPELNLACCGIAPNATKEQWIKLGEEIAARGGMPANVNLFGTEDSLLSEPVKRTMESLHELFSQAPVLGSLIDPSKLRVDLFQTDYKTVAPLMTAVLKAEQATEETRERVIAAAGMVKAATLLAGKYSLVMTNVPYLGRGRQNTVLAEHCSALHSEARADLATCFVDRCLQFCQHDGTTALVTPQNWLYQVTYQTFLEWTLREQTWQWSVRMGPRAFQEVTGEVVKAALIVVSRSTPSVEDRFATLNVTSAKKPHEKASALRNEIPKMRFQAEPEINVNKSLRRFARCYQGISTGDNPHEVLCFWEIQDVTEWKFFQVPSEVTTLIGGRTSVVRSSLLSVSNGDATLRGREAWGNKGIAIARVGSLAASLYDGDLFANTLPVIIPDDEALLPAIWTFVNSPDFHKAVSQVSQSLSVDNGYLEKITFDVDRWKTAASSLFPDGIQGAGTANPTQWLFSGDPKSSDSPLLVAVARLLGYRWPHQTGSSFPDCPPLDPDGLESFAAEDGIVPLKSNAGEASAANRLRALLAAAYGEEWSAAKLAELLGDNESLEIWLRDHFFDEHCNLFKTKETRPFVWHVWDGRKDGFHALVNYHKLAAPNGEGRKTLEKLIYTTLGDWITRQRADVTTGVDGADGRLAAAEHLRTQLEKILQGEKPYDIFVRWKPLDQQPIGWEPDINDGVRMNIRPWVTATLSPGTKPKKDACILRVTPKTKYDKDRGREPHRKREDFPWLWTWDEKTDDFAGGAVFDGARWNDPHYSLSAKQKARDRKKQREGA
jgi:hypothetical protein